MSLTTSLASIRLCMSSFMGANNAEEHPHSHNHRPLLPQFGSAIFIGLACGLILTLITNTTFTLLGLYDGPKATYSPSRNASQLSIPRTQPDTDDDQKQLDALLAGISSGPESDHLIATLQGAGWRDPANTKRKRRSMNAGLRFGTILEEDDDSL